MAISPYLAALRDRIGNDLLLVPTVAVLPLDDRGRVLLVRQIDTGQWATIGGPEYRITYPNGDLTSCVPIVYEGRVVSGDPAPDGDETSEVGWFDHDALDAVDLTPVNRHLLREAFAMLR